MHRDTGTDTHTRCQAASQPLASNLIDTPCKILYTINKYIYRHICVDTFIQTHTRKIKHCDARKQRQPVASNQYVLLHLTTIY